MRSNKLCLFPAPIELVFFPKRTINIVRYGFLRCLSAALPVLLVWTCRLLDCVLLLTVPPHASRVASQSDVHRQNLNPANVRRIPHVSEMASTLLEIDTARQCQHAGETKKTAAETECAKPAARQAFRDALLALGRSPSTPAAEVELTKHCLAKVPGAFVLRNVLSTPEAESIAAAVRQAHREWEADKVAKPASQPAAAAPASANLESRRQSALHIPFKLAQAEDGDAMAALCARVERFLPTLPGPGVSLEEDADPAVDGEAPSKRRRIDGESDGASKHQAGRRAAGNDWTKRYTLDSAAADGSSLSKFLRLYWYRGEGAASMPHFDKSFREHGKLPSDPKEQLLRFSAFSVLFYVSFCRADGHQDAPAEPAKSGATTFFHDPREQEPPLAMTRSGLTLKDTDGDASKLQVMESVEPRTGDVLVFPHGEFPGSYPNPFHEGSTLQADTTEKILVRTDIMYCLNQLAAG